MHYETGDENGECGRLITSTKVTSSITTVWITGRSRAATTWSRYWPKPGSTNTDSTTIAPSSIEDASFRQSGIIQTVFNYGTIRLSTEGEETTYIFHFVARPREQIAVINNAIEDFKNGRPVCDD